MTKVELEPIPEPKQAYDQIEARLKKFFRDLIYLPLLKDLGLSRTALQNASDTNPLMDALFTGEVMYSKGVFSGNFNAGISKALRELGAVFHRKTGTYRLPESQIPTQMKLAISGGRLKFQEKLKKIDLRLSKIIPKELADQFKVADIFDQTIYKADKSFQKNIKNITVAPTFTPQQRAQISQEWQDNMNLWIQGWTEKEIKDLRKNIFESVMSGQRKESLIPPILKVTRTIQDSHDKAVNKAKFLAHQETRLLVAKLKEVRYTSAGIHEYIWRCVHRPHDTDPRQHTPGNVRYSHGLLNGKTFRWDNPPITTNPGEPVRRNNPGQDYRCRCFPRPVLIKRAE